MVGYYFIRINAYEYICEVNMKDLTDLREVVKSIETYQDSDKELSKILLTLTAMLFYFGSKLASSQLRYSKEIVKILQSEKKVSVAQAEREADVITECEHDSIRYKKDAVLEMINSIKARLRVLTGEYNNSDTQ